jgi:pimeloyl-ACP methyl ester carboxylesterase
MPTAAVAEIFGGVEKSVPVEGFRLAYERIGHGPAVVLLHGWPGDRTDYRHVVPILSPTTDVVVPDLRGFGESDKHRSDPAVSYSADAQARSVVGLIEELGLDQPVIGGYDIGSRIAQTMAWNRPDLVRALVIAPPLPGIADRILTARAHQEFWYQPFYGSTSPTGSSTVAGRPCVNGRGRTTGSRRRRRCSGQNTTRCSRWPGPTGSTISSPTPG